MLEKITKYKPLIKIGIVLILAFLVSNLLIKEVFLSYSPQIRPNLPQYIAFRVGGLIAKANLVASIFNKNIKTAPVTASLNALKEASKTISVGVKASTGTNASYIEYDLNKVQWRIIEYTLSNGKTVKIKVPVGGDNSVPPIEAIEKNYK